MGAVTALLAAMRTFNMHFPPHGVVLRASNQWRLECDWSHVSPGSPKCASQAAAHASKEEPLHATILPRRALSSELSS
jgi:hypothetical protein